MKKFLFFICLFLPAVAFSFPPLTPENIQGFTGGRTTRWGFHALSETQRNGSTTLMDDPWQRAHGALFEEAEYCHNYGTTCHCKKAKFYIDTTRTLWQHKEDIGQETNIACPAGITPTGDKDAATEQAQHAAVMQEQQDFLQKKRECEAAGKNRVKNGSYTINRANYDRICGGK